MGRCEKATARAADVAPVHRVERRSRRRSAAPGSSADPARSLPPQYEGEEHQVTRHNLVEDSSEIQEIGRIEIRLAKNSDALQDLVRFAKLKILTV